MYDFSLPLLLLHATTYCTAVNMRAWLRICPRRQITVLDTHDGMGIDDIEGLAQASSTLTHRAPGVAKACTVHWTMCASPQHLLHSTRACWPCRRFLGKGSLPFRLALQTHLRLRAPVWCWHACTTAVLLECLRCLTPPAQVVEIEELKQVITDKLGCGPNFKWVAFQSHPVLSCPWVACACTCWGLAAAMPQPPAARCKLLELNASCVAACTGQQWGSPKMR